MNTSETEPFTSLEKPFTRASEGKEPAKATSKARIRPNLHCAMPKSLQYRLSYIIKAERRTVATVIDKVVEDFLACSDNEPRPYIPSELSDEETCSTNYSIAPTNYESLRDRARLEGRSPQTLFIRAVYEYVHNSEDDPVKTGKPLGKVEGATKSNVSDSESEDGSGGGSE